MAATPDDISDADLDSIGAQPTPSTGGSFSDWFQQHQRAVLVIGGITLLLTVYLIFRRSSSSASTTTSSGQPAQPGMTTDTASALNQQTTLLEALAQAVANLQKQQQPGANPPPAPPPSGNSAWYAFLSQLPTNFRQWLQTYWAGLSAAQQQTFMNEPLSTQEAQINQLETQFNSANSAPVVPASREHITQSTWPPTLPHTPYNAPPAAA